MFLTLLLKTYHFTIWIWYPRIWLVLLLRRFCVRARNLWLLWFYENHTKISKALFSCKCCSFLHTLEIALNMACAPNATRSRCFAAGVCWFPEFTFWVLLVFSIGVHHSAVERPLPLDPWHCRCLSEAYELNPFLVGHLVAQFGSCWLPRVLTIRLLVFCDWCQVALMMQLCLFQPYRHTRIHVLVLFHLVWASL